MSNVIQLPIPARLCAAREAITVRANRLGATEAQRRRALAVLIRELDAGRSTASAVALANSAMLRDVRAAAWCPPPSGDAA